MMSALKLSGEYAVAAFSRMARRDCRRLMRPLGRAGAATAGNSLFAMTLIVAQPAASWSGRSLYQSSKVANRHHALRHFPAIFQSAAVVRSDAFVVDSALRST